MFYVTQLHAGHFYISTTTAESRAGFHVPADFDKAYTTRQEAEAGRALAVASIKAAAAAARERLVSS